MAKLVLAAGVPHPPRLVYEMAQAPGKMKGEALMKQVRNEKLQSHYDIWRRQMSGWSGSWLR